jgi:hypothetical protein
LICEFLAGPFSLEPFSATCLYFEEGRRGGGDVSFELSAGGGGVDFSLRDVDSLSLTFENDRDSKVAFTIWLFNLVVADVHNLAKL